MNEKNQNVVVVGLGYVGLPMAVLSVKNGYNVKGLETSQEKIDLINSGKSSVEDGWIEDVYPDYQFPATDDPSILKEADIVLVCVPTPIDNNFQPNLNPIKGATKTIVDNLKKGALIVLESTVNPGVSETIIKPIFDEAGYAVGKDYDLAHCPERIDPGKSAFSSGYTAENLNRVVGAMTKEGTARAADFYRSILTAEIHEMKSIREAEATKIMENSFRDINIAFVNELAKSFDRLGIDIYDVIKGASTKPYAFMPHFPSCGVGGHCIPVDPYYLIEHAKSVGFDHKLLKESRAINNSMPEYTVELLQDKLNSIEKALKNASVGVLGISFKPNIDDDRESPYYEIIKHLKKHEANTVSYDPYLPEKSDVASLEELLQKTDVVILTANHDEFVKMDLELLKKHDIKIIIDGKNCLDKDTIEGMDIIYKGIGR